jgi:hypothetical protein
MLYRVFNDQKNAGQSKRLNALAELVLPYEVVTFETDPFAKI